MARREDLSEADDPRGRVGNGLQPTDHTTAGDFTTDCGYPAAGAGRPRAVTTETRTDGNGTATYGYSYDKAGTTFVRGRTGSRR